MVHDVFKFPDGKGGYILKIMGPDQKWHVCDEAGNYTEEKQDPAPEPRPERTSEKAVKKTSGSRNRKTSLYMSDSLSKRLRHYCVENNTSMCAVINMAVSEFLSAKES